MSSAPEIVTRPEQPCAAIRVQVTMAELGAVVPPLNQEVFAWLGKQGVPPVGAPFWKYNVIDMAGKLEIEAGVPVAAAVAGDDRVISGVLPAGRYATLTHVGHPSELMAATEALLDWAAEQGLTWDVTPSEDGERWACRLENYLTDPSQEPDMSKWVTELAFKLAGERSRNGRGRAIGSPGAPEPERRRRFTRCLEPAHLSVWISSRY